MKSLKNKIFRPKDSIDFGKNAGLQLSEIYQYEPNYIEWLIINDGEFKIYLEEFQSLPKPTPLLVGAVTGSKKRKDLFKNGKGLFQTDNINMHFSVAQIKEILSQNKSIEKEINYKFSEEAILINKKKIEKLNNI